MPPVLPAAKAAAHHSNVLASLSVVVDHVEQAENADCYEQGRQAGQDRCKRDSGLSRHSRSGIRSTWRILLVQVSFVQSRNCQGRADTLSRSGGMALGAAAPR
jgi:hypothetical protein